MFGYVTINKPELKLRELDSYRTFYCGLCRTLKKRFGVRGQTTLSFDMTFLGLLLTALYEPESRSDTIFCPLHPFEKHTAVGNDCLDYAADMNVLLAYFDLRDDWKDEHKPGAAVLSGLLRPRMWGLFEAYPRQARAVGTYIRELSRCEKENAADLDRAAGLTGQMLSEIFVRTEDAWAPYLRRIGFFLGKFIYLMDAYEDMEKDLRTGSYNPWLSLGSSRQTVKEKALPVLNLMMSECSLAFEQLPILLHGDLLRNILYAGVWCRFEQICAEDEKAASEKSGRRNTPHDL